MSDMIAGIEMPALMRHRSRLMVDGHQSSLTGPMDFGTLAVSVRWGCGGGGCPMRREWEQGKRSYPVSTLKLTRSPLTTRAGPCLGCLNRAQP